jgi:hypothetical protein
MSISYPNSVASVHRFGELVALYIPGMPEIAYLSAAEAGKLARALNKVARSVKTERFAGYRVGTISVPLVRTDRFRGSDT